MGDAIRIEDGRLPLLIVRMLGQPTDEEFAAYLEAYEALMRRSPGYGIVYVTMPNAPMTRSRHARMQATWIREHEDEIKAKCRCVAFVLPSPLMRGVLRAIMSMQSMPVPYQVFEDEKKAEAWVLGFFGATSADAALPG